MVEIKEETISKINTILAGVKDADKRVLKPALARGQMAGKTAASKEARKTYHISASTFNSKGHLKYNSVSATGQGVIGSLEYSGAVIPLSKYKITPTTPKNGKAPKVAVLKSSGLTQLENAFVAQMKSGHIGVFERVSGKYAIKGREGKNKHSEKIKELLSPSVPHQLANVEVNQKVEERMQEVINERIEHEIERIFQGIGG